MTKNVESLIQFNPMILILADRHYNLFRNRLPKTIIVWTRHGFASKNEAGKGVTGCDFACVSSEWVRNEFIRQGFIPTLGFWVTGFPAADILFQKRSNLDYTLLPENFSSGKATLLYVPTYNELLNSVNVLGERWIDKLKEILPEINVIIKPHPVIPERNPKWMDMWRNATNRNERILLIEDSHSSVYQYLPFADILLSDASSVIFYFLAFNKPIILVNNPNRFKERQFFDEKGPEWTWRDMAFEIDNANQLPSAVLRCLETPKEKSEKRLIYKERVFGNLCDGKSAERIADRIKTLLTP
jgi:CDP-glycerol glycerophosphotransferase (TagB/SpsB family)